jgi:hypothetical protein
MFLTRILTAAHKALPPGIELNVDRGKAVPLGIESKVGTVTPDVDTIAEKGLSPGTELNADRGERAGPGVVAPDNDVDHEKPSWDESGQN